MSKIINLRQTRKRAERDAKRQNANQNAALHGRTKAEKALQQAQAVRAAQALSGHKRDG
jgi:hypothetical protein